MLAKAAVIRLLLRRWACCSFGRGPARRKQKGGIGNRTLQCYWLPYHKLLTAAIIMTPMLAAARHGLGSLPSAPESLTAAQACRKAANVTGWTAARQSTPCCARAQSGLRLRRACGFIACRVRPDKLTRYGGRYSMCMLPARNQLYSSVAYHPSLLWLHDLALYT